MSLARGSPRSKNVETYTLSNTLNSYITKFIVDLKGVRRTAKEAFTVQMY